MAWRRGTSVFSVIWSGTCPFTRELWFYILQALGLQLPRGASSTLSWWRRLHALSNGQQREGMDSLFELVSEEGAQRKMLPRLYSYNQRAPADRQRRSRTLDLRRSKRTRSVGQAIVACCDVLVDMLFR